MQNLLLALALLGLGLGGAQAGTVRIGHAGPLTGPLAHIGKDGENGARLAIEDANAQGIVIDGDKITFELLGEDDQADPRQATTVAQRLADEEVAGVVGHVTSSASIPASRVYEQNGIPMITPSATSPKLTAQGYRTTFRVIANDLQQGAAMAHHVAAGLHLKRVAVIDDRSAYGQGLADAFADKLKADGVDVVAREFTSDKATDFSAILTKIKGTAPDAVFFGGFDAQAAPMLQQMRQLSLNAAFLGGDGVCTDEMLKLAARTLDAHVFCTQAGIPMAKMPKGADFKARFAKRFHTPVQLYAPYSYDATMALIEAMKAADSTDPADYLPKLHTISFPGVTGTIAFDAKGDIRTGGISLYQYKDGHWATLN
ncbi:branched-chain amino acid ABC transporter substrate-binding protein [Nitrogeniibacter mangrovi]|uniref:Branched-chain amino acid ABC transporter substrate-binding protein n=1 Tax=Nitrogeniibacter mangrovi TaxID=2016596 RepID=A0A6C1B8L4_9RHOO|nr:branched-chain amino acid ABC transporter substrate-binding protein [Nitrogeniibacter mangrovi]QID19299.1 branched-chain amino acid ABC transporter substrate-binding protein [Nitrogeniibacter mangrovi]